jgi:hypothetical protein
MIRKKGAVPAVVAVEVISDEILSHGIISAARENYDSVVSLLKSDWPELI